MTAVEEEARRFEVGQYVGSVAEYEALPVGAVLREDGSTITLTKQGDGQWLNSRSGSTHPSENYGARRRIEFLPTWNWQVGQRVYGDGVYQQLPVGTVLVNGRHTLTKTGPDEWRDNVTGHTHGSAHFGGERTIQYLPTDAEPAPRWQVGQEVTADDLDALPVGTAIGVRGDGSGLVKQNDGRWLRSDGELFEARGLTMRRYILSLPDETTTGASFTYAGVDYIVGSTLDRQALYAAAPVGTVVYEPLGRTWEKVTANLWHCTSETRADRTSAGMRHLARTITHLPTVGNEPVAAEPDERWVIGAHFDAETQAEDAPVGLEFRHDDRLTFRKLNDGRWMREDNNIYDNMRMHTTRGPITGLNVRREFTVGEQIRHEWEYIDALPGTVARDGENTYIKEDEGQWRWTNNDRRYTSAQMRGTRRTITAITPDDGWPVGRVLSSIADYTDAPVGVVVQAERGNPVRKVHPRWWVEIDGERWVWNLASGLNNARTIIERLDPDAHPLALETQEDYENAPIGTVVTFGCNTVDPTRRNTKQPDGTWARSRNGGSRTSRQLAGESGNVRAVVSWGSGAVFDQAAYLIEVAESLRHIGTEGGWPGPARAGRVMLGAEPAPTVGSGIDPYCLQWLPGFVGWVQTPYGRVLVTGAGEQGFKVLARDGQGAVAAEEFIRYDHVQGGNDGRGEVVVAAPIPAREFESRMQVVEWLQEQHHKMQRTYQWCGTPWSLMQRAHLTPDTVIPEAPVVPFAAGDRFRLGRREDMPRIEALPAGTQIRGVGDRHLRVKLNDQWFFVESGAPSVLGGDFEVTYVPDPVAVARDEEPF